MSLGGLMVAPPTPVDYHPGALGDLSLFTGRDRKASTCENAI